MGSVSDKVKGKFGLCAVVGGARVMNMRWMRGLVWSYTCWVGWDVMVVFWVEEVKDLHEMV